MAFFADEVHLLASASIDGKVFIWKIDEGPDHEGKPQITGKLVLAVHLIGGGEYHPRICWHSHKQEILVVGIGSLVLKIDTIKVVRGKEFSADEPLRCSLDKLVDGVQLVGRHDAEVTDLSISQWMTTRLASASNDGTVKIWEDRRAMPLATLMPHEGQPVNSVAFLMSPHRPDHITLLTSGPLNREVKMWTSTAEEGWLLPSDAESWQCSQTLELRSSVEPRVDEAFFNQVVVLPQASLVLLANAKKNAIYAVHIDYGPCPAATRMDYIVDFSVTMPILSLTGTSDIFPDGEHVVQIYCVQTQAIQQYALNLLQCLPPIVDGPSFAKDPSISHVYDGNGLEAFSAAELTCAPSDLPSASSIPSAVSSSATITSSEVNRVPVLSSSSIELQPSAPNLLSLASETSPATSSPIPNSELSGRSSGIRGVENKPSRCDPDVDQEVSNYQPDQGEHVVPGSKQDCPVVSDHFISDNLNVDPGDVKAGPTDTSMIPNSHLMFKLGGTTHLVTPSEILSGIRQSPETTNVSQKIDEVKLSNLMGNNESSYSEVVVKEVDESTMERSQEVDSWEESKDVSVHHKDEVSHSLSPEIKNEISKEGGALTTNLCNASDVHVGNYVDAADALDQLPRSVAENDLKNTTDLLQMETEEFADVPIPKDVKAKNGKAKNLQESGLSSPSSSPSNSMDSSNEPEGSLGGRPIEAAFSQITSIHEVLNQILSMQKEMQKQISLAVTAPITKEGKRVEVSLGRTIEKATKGNIDALWARFQEENAKREKAEKDRLQQVTTLITNFINKDLPSVLEKALKRDISSIGPSVTRSISPVIEKAISSAIVDSFQRGVGDKAVNQLEKSISSKLEATIARQIQTQFQTSGRQALQDALRTSLESSLIPAFEQSCKALFEQVDGAFHKGMSEHTSAAQQQFESSHSSLALTLRDAINSASSITQSFTADLMDGQRKLISLVSANAKALNPLAMQQSNGPMAGLPEMAISVQQVEAPLDPTKELSRLISERKFDEAFTMALQRSDVTIVSWLCSQVDPRGILSIVPLPVSQGVLLALLQQLACDIGNDTARKLGWMTDVAAAINPADPIISVHVRPIFEQVYNILAHQRTLPLTTSAEASSIRLIMHVINSVLMSCK
ncbi:hypothetical protein HPP92_017323 [Vanilla planifolia]|uniref:Enhancer of mRNA-decapping protein 4 C-terminal domain-containing protein n=1 Tax=Vanilla planifolia TaxID=51239 RepID=A0A835UPJ0_VANPL|nr:hypothetical protein HPP92_017323 [Vanilla planifolia]